MDAFAESMGSCSSNDDRLGVQDYRGRGLLFRGGFFRFIRQEGFNIKAECLNCKQGNLYSARNNAGSNFVKHLSVRNPFFEKFFLLFFNFFLNFEFFWFFGIFHWARLAKYAVIVYVMFLYNFIKSSLFHKNSECTRRNMSDIYQWESKMVFVNHKTWPNSGRMILIGLFWILW